MKKNELRIQNISKELNDELKMISKNCLQTKCELLRPLIRKIVNKHSDQIKDVKSTRKSELRITGVSESLIDDLKKISSNLGINQNELIKLELIEEIKKMPDYLKTLND